MSGQFDDFHQLAIRRGPGDDQSRLLQACAVGVVEFVAVAVAFTDFSFSIGRSSQTALLHFERVFQFDVDVFSTRLNVWHF